MMAVIVKVLIAATLTGTLSVAANHDAFTAINTLLNFASWWLLIKAQHKLRSEVTPKLDKVEDVAYQLEEQILNPLPGGKRSTDPPVKKS